MLKSIAVVALIFTLLIAEVLVEINKQHSSIIKTINITDKEGSYNLIFIKNNHNKIVIRVPVE